MFMLAIKEKGPTYVRSYSYMRLNGSELVVCWGSEYKGLAPDTMPGRCSTCDSTEMHTGVGIQ